MTYTKQYIKKINKDIDTLLTHFEKKGQPKPHLFHITDDMTIERSGVPKLVMTDRYTYKDIELITLSEGDFVILTVKDDPNFPTRGYGTVLSIDWTNRKAIIEVDSEFLSNLPEGETTITRDLDDIEKPLELFYEQISLRNAKGLSEVETTQEKKDSWFKKFYDQLVKCNFIPAGRVLYGAGSATDVTFFNCYVMPFIQDSRGGISDHRKKTMEIMSRGGGVGTNGSTLRPKNTLARGVNGKSSGSVSWLDDIAKLTHLVEQGGSRRGAQMLMMADWHPDIIEFIISKMQNPNILRFIIKEFEDEHIVQLAKEKLKFTPFKQDEKDQLEFTLNSLNMLEAGLKINNDTLNEKQLKMKNDIITKLNDGGIYSVHKPEFLTGANISVAITHDFMQAVENDEMYSLRFPATESYTKEEMEYYNENWHKVGDVREWEKLGYAVREYRKVKASVLWNLINIAATYSAEPGIFFIDNANDMTNAKAYGQKVVATNPCGTLNSGRFASSKKSGKIGEV